jgi:predicted alpha-1,6-mannanase (GH76 family)
LRAFRLTSDERYLSRAEAIFDDIVNRSWSDASCGGGCCWQASRDPKNMVGCYKNAITNELFASLGAQLSGVHAARCAASAAHGHAACATARSFHDWASRALTWFVGSGMINGSSLINDGLDTFSGHAQICRNNGHAAYTYNQGVLLSALGALYESPLPPPQWVGGATVDAAAAAVAVQPTVVAEANPRPSMTAAEASRHHDGAAARATDDGRASLLRLGCQVVEAVWASHLVYNQTGGVLREEGEATLVDGNVQSTARQ